MGTSISDYSGLVCSLEDHRSLENFIKIAKILAEKNKISVDEVLDKSYFGSFVLKYLTMSKEVEKLKQNPALLKLLFRHFIRNLDWIMKSSTSPSLILENISSLDDASILPRSQMAQFLQNSPEERAILNALHKSYPSLRAELNKVFPNNAEIIQTDSLYIN